MLMNRLKKRKKGRGKSGSNDHYLTSGSQLKKYFRLRITNKKKIQVSYICGEKEGKATATAAGKTGNDGGGKEKREKAFFLCREEKKKREGKNCPL